MGECFVISIISVQSTRLSADPEITFAIFQNTANEIRRNAVRIIRIRLKHGEAVAIIFIQSFIGAEPQKSLAVLVDAIDLAVRETIFDGDVGEFQILLLGVEFYSENRW